MGWPLFLSRRVLRLAGGAATAAAAGWSAAAVIIAIGHDGVNVPSWDQWELVPLLGKLEGGQLTLSDLWAQHNEHRIFFPRIVMLALASLSRWNVIWEMYTNVFIAAVTLLVLFKLLSITVNPVEPSLTRWLGVPVAMLVFSMAQWENWTWGWQVQIFMSACGAAVAAWALARWPGRWCGLGIAHGAAVFSSLSFSNGLALLWLVPGGFLLSGPRKKWLALLVSSTAAALTTWAYLLGYEKPAQHPEYRYVLDHPALSACYVLAYLGSALGAGNLEAAEGFGIIGITVLLVSAHQAWVRGSISRTTIVPWLFLAAYVLASAATTALGRVGFGVTQALASRYTTISVLFWVSVSVLGSLALTLYARSRPAGLWRRIVVGSSAALILALASIGHTRSCDKGRADLKARAARLRSGQECLAHDRLASDRCLTILYPSATAVRNHARTLEAIELGPFSVNQ